MKQKIRLLPLARFVLFWEKLWVAFWPGLAVASMFIGLALLEVPRHLPPLVHLTGLVAFVFFFVLALRQGFQALGDHPSDDAARRRLEQDSGLAHRPLEALEDELSVGRADRAARRLWEAHQERELHRSRRLRLRWPSPRLANHDRWALRAVALLVLVVGVAAGHGNPGERLAGAFQTRWAISTEVTRDMLEVWVTPPGYTGKAPVYLTQAQDAHTPSAAGATQNPVLVPAGSTVMARFVAGGQRQHDLTLRVGKTEAAMEGAKDGGFEAEIAAESGDDIVVRDHNRIIARWAAEIVADRPPLLVFLDPPEEQEQARLAFRFLVGDDYGLDSLALEIRLEDELEMLLVETGQESHRLAVPPGHVGKGVESKGNLNFFSHPWSGLSANVRLVATDAAGQTTAAGPISMLLPIREFQQPVAKELVALRGRLKAEEKSRVAAAAILDQLSRSPAQFHDDTAVFLGMRIARRRLLNNPSPHQVAETRRLIWEIALELEDGGLSQASRRFQSALDRLQRAIEEGASDEEMERLISEVQQALDDYMRKLQEMARDGRLAMVPMSPDSQVMDPRQMRELTEMLREMLRTGDKESAQQMLEALRSMMNGMQTQMGRSQLDNQQMRQATEMMRNMQDLLKRQEELHKRTFDQSQRQDQDGQDGEKSAADIQAEQESIRRQLGEMMRQLGEMNNQIPKSLGQAEQSMRQAEGELGKGDAQGALPSQAEAIDALRRGMGEAMQQMAQGMRGMGPGMGMDPRQGRRPMNTPNRDPLDRDPEGYDGMATGDVNIPARGDIQKSRKILDELHRRANDRGRDPMELNYIQRLLDLF